MKPCLGNAPRATPVAATSGANARQRGLGRVREVQPPGLASHAARPSHRGADRARRCRQSRVEAAAGCGRRRPWRPARDHVRGKASRCTRHEGGASASPSWVLAPPASVATQPSDQGFCTDSTVQLPGSNRGVGSPALAVRRTAPAGGAKRGPPRSQGTPERARLKEPVNGQPTEPACQSRWSARLRAGASRLTGCPGPPGRSTAPPARTRRPGVLALWGEVASLGQSIEKLSAPSKPSRRIN